MNGSVSGVLPEMLEGSISGMIKSLGGAPVLETLDINANGQYTPPSGVDGYNVVNVNVPERIPVVETLNVNTNGQYTPPSGVDGYDEVNVNVPAPVFDTLNVISNGQYTPPSGVDGYDEVNVNVPAPVLRTLNINENGTYTPPSGVDGYNEIVVNVSQTLLYNILNVKASKAENAYNIYITVKDENNNTLISINQPCNVYGEFNQTSQTFIYNGSTYTITYRGIHAEDNNPFLFIDITNPDVNLINNNLSFIANGANSSYGLSSSTIVIDYTLS